MKCKSISLIVLFVSSSLFFVSSCASSPGACDCDEAPSAVDEEEVVQDEEKEEIVEEAGEADESAGSFDWITKDEDGNVVFERAALKAQFQDPSSLTESGRVIPNYSDGDPNGIRLIQVNPEGFYAAIGIKSGDIIHYVGEKRVTSGPEFSEAMEGASDDDEFIFKIERIGNPDQINFIVR